MTSDDRHAELHVLADHWGIPVIVDPMDQQQIADYLGVEYATFRSRRTRGLLPGFPAPARDGKVPLWHGHEVRAWNETQA